MLAQNLEDIQSKALPGAKFGTGTKLGETIGDVLPYIFGAAGIALLIYLIFGGFQLMTSRGDPKAIQSAQGKITNALIGFAIIVVAFFVVQLLGQLFNIRQFGDIFGK